MKSRHLTRWLVVGALAVTLLPIAVAQGAKIRMPDFSGLAEKAKEAVEISLDGDQLKNASSFFAGGRAPDPALTEALKGLQAIYVKVFEFDAPNQYSMRDIETVLRQVEREGWKKMMSVRSREERVEMWMRENHEDGGMFLVVSEPSELVMVNIVGNVDLQALSQLQGKMGIPGIPGVAPPAPPPPPARPAAPAGPR